MSLGYGSIYTLLADLRDRYGFTEAQLGRDRRRRLPRRVRRAARARPPRRPRVRAAARAGRRPAGDGGDDRQRRRHRVLGVPRSPACCSGSGSGAVGPAIRRIVITRDPDAVGANLGRLAAFDVAGFMLGPLVAAVVAEAFGIRAPFVFLAAVFVGVFVLASRLDLTAGAAPTRTRGHALRALLVRPAIQATLAACVAFYLTVGMFEAIWAVLLRDHGAETWLIGLTLSMFTLPMIFLAPIGGRQAQARGPLRVVSVSLTIATICTFSYGVLPSLWMLLAVSLVHAVADSFTMPSNQVAAALGSPPEHLSAAQGLLGATGPRGRRAHRPRRRLPLRGGRAGRRCAPAPRWS